MNLQLHINMVKWGKFEDVLLPGHKVVLCVFYPATFKGGAGTKP